MPLGYLVHHLNPIIVSLGPIQPRWYGLAYLLGFLGAYVLIMKQSRDGMLRLAPERVPDFVLNGCIFGVLIGGRLGYVLFYDLPNALHHEYTPLLWSFTRNFPFWGLLRVNDGGMSAHGGVVFTILTLLWFARKYKVSPINIGDAACMVVPIGLFFGRIANFINGELYGHPSTVPWAVKFPSEIYAPTNGDMEVPAGRLMEMQNALASHIGQHWQTLSTRQVRDFLTNVDHRDLYDMLVKQYGTIPYDSAVQLTEIKRAISTYVTMDPTAITPSDLGNWWQHGGNSDLIDLMRHWFDTILPSRHPSQLYEALLEGVLLFTICWTIGRRWRKDGMASGAFLTLYPVMRIIGEQFRVGDSALAGGHATISAGVWYSVAMLVPGVIFWIYWIKRDRRIAWVPVVALPASGRTEARQ